MTGLVSFSAAAKTRTIQGDGASREESAPASRGRLAVLSRQPETGRPRPVQRQTHLSHGLAVSAQSDSGSTRALACFDPRPAGRNENPIQSQGDDSSEHANVVGEGADHSKRGRVRSPSQLKRCTLGVWILLGMVTMGMLLVGTAVAEPRFPPPDFEGGYQVPSTQTPLPRAVSWHYIDALVLVAALSLASYLVFKKRSRRAVFGLSLFSLAYFGFYREGCVCSIGSLQNVALALGDRGYAVPWTVAVFFFAPLLVSLFFGRTFCAAVCPHGALQDLVLLKPVKVPAWLEQGLGLVPFIFLGAGVLFAVTGSAFVICRYDPFVPLFRLSGSFSMLMLGAAFLLVGMFVGRPYCRFLCPYGALLKLAAMVSKWRVRVTPNTCTQCRLCEASCPYGALREPWAPPPNPLSLRLERKRLAGFLVLLPVLIGLTGWLGGRLSVAASRLHPDVALAERFVSHAGQPIRGVSQTPETLALSRAEKNPKELLAAALETRRRFGWGGWLFGGWVGLVVGLKFVGLALRQTRADYEPDRGACLACARCFEFCPNELVRRGIMPALGPGCEAPPSLATGEKSH